MPGQSLSDLSVDIEDDLSDLSEDDLTNMSLEIEDDFAVAQAAQAAQAAQVAQVDQVDQAQVEEAPSGGDHPKEMNVESVAKTYVDESLLLVENRLSRGELKCLLHNIKKKR